MTHREAAPAPDGLLFDPATQLGRDLAEVDWAATPLGAPETLAASLRSVVRLLLGSRFAMWMAWGNEYTFLCNDAYRRNTLGAKYPWALGRPASEVWAEIWPDIGPRIELGDRAPATATWDEDLLLFLERSGYPEETYHTFSYSPIYGDDGAVSGMLCVVSEETARVVSERRMRIVRDLGDGPRGGRHRGRGVRGGGAAAQPRRAQPAVHARLPVLRRRGRRRRDRVDSWTAGIERAHHARARSDIAVRDGDAVWPARRDPGRPRAHRRRPADPRSPTLPTGAWPRAAACRRCSCRSRSSARPAVRLPRRRAQPIPAPGQRLPAASSSSSPARSRRRSRARGPSSRSAGAPRSSPSSTAPRPPSSRTSATSCARPLTLLLGPAEDALADGDDALPPAHRQRLEVIATQRANGCSSSSTRCSTSPGWNPGRMQPRFEAARPRQAHERTRRDVRLGGRARRA